MVQGCCSFEWIVLEDWYLFIVELFESLDECLKVPWELLISYAFLKLEALEILLQREQLQI